MPCFFCKSDNHKSKNCEIYVTDETRNNLLHEKKCCHECWYLTEKYGVDNEWCEHYISPLKCYGCFSKNHHTKDCVDSLTGSNIFPPNINQNVLPRFLQTLKFEENFHLIFTYPDVFTLMKPQSFKITYKRKVYHKSHLTFQSSDLVVVDEFSYDNDFSKLKNIKELLNSTILRIEDLKISSCDISANELIMLLSAKTKFLESADANIYPKMMLTDILKEVPNLQELSITQTNVVLTNNWADDLFLLNDLNYLYLEILDFGFDVKSLAALIKEKNVKTHLFIKWPRNKPFKYERDYQEATNALSSHFNPKMPKNSSEASQFLEVIILHNYAVMKQFAIQCYKLKDL